MNKLLKALLGILIALIVVVLLAVILVPILIDPNDYKAEITSQVQKQTGRDLTIEGDIDLAFSLPLSISLELGKIELSNAKGFGEKPFASIQGASVYVSIWPLVTENRLDVGKITLSGMQLNLAKNKQGKTNWDNFAKPKPEQTDKAETPAPQTTETSEPTALPAINLAGVNINDAQINWLDEQANQSVSLAKTNITISELVENKPFTFDFNTQLSTSNPDIKGTISLSSQPTVALSTQLFTLKETLLSIDLTGSLLPGGANKTTLGGDITFDGQAQVLDISGLKLNTYDMEINGKFHADSLNTGPKFNGEVNIAQFSPKKLASTLGVELPKMKEANALSSADAKLSFKGDTNNVQIDSLEANLDNTSLTGNAQIKNFQAPSYGFDLALNQINLDYYATEAQPQEPTSPGSNESQSSIPAGPDTTKSTPPGSTDSNTAKPAPRQPIFPIETLRQLNLDGKLTIGQFIAAGAKMSDVVIVLKGDKGLVQLAPLKANLYQGSINLNTQIDARGNTPKLKVVNELKQVKLGELLQDTTGTQEFIGTADISTDISTQGNYQDVLIKNTNGKGHLFILDGHIKKLDVLNTLRKAQALYRGKAAPTQAQKENTKFTELKGTYNIKNGVITNNDLSSKSPVMEFSGKGYVDLPKEYLDYTLTINVLNSLKIDEDTQGTDYRGKDIPYTIKGKFSELDQKADVSKALKQAVKKKLEKKLNKELEKKLGEEFKDFLKF